MKVVRSPTEVDAGTPELEEATGRPDIVKVEFVCPFSPWGKPHVIKLEVLHEEWQEVMEWKYGGKAPREVAWDQYTGQTWAPYSGIELAGGRRMEMEVVCPFCGKNFRAILKVPDWVINALPDELNP